jgi:membrane protein YdbS with pleckstrin-like domain
MPQKKKVMEKRNERTKQKNNLTSGINIKLVLRLACIVMCVWLLTKVNAAVWALLALVVAYSIVRFLIKCVFRFIGLLISVFLILLIASLIIVFIF